MKDLALCRECARARGVFDPRNLSLSHNIFPTELSGEVEEFIRRMLDGVLTDEKEGAGEKAGPLPDMLTKCPTCNYPLESYRELGMLGCPECYKVFAAELTGPQGSSNLEVMAHDADAAPDFGELPDMERKRLETLLQIAVGEENYEEAAHLRDIIKTLPKK